MWSSVSRACRAGRKPRLHTCLLSVTDFCRVMFYVSANDCAWNYCRLNLFQQDWNWYLPCVKEARFGGDIKKRGLKEHTHTDTHTHTHTHTHTRARARASPKWAQSPQRNNYEFQKCVCVCICVRASVCAWISSKALCGGNSHKRQICFHGKHIKTTFSQESEDVFRMEFCCCCRCCKARCSHPCQWDTWPQKLPLLLPFLQGGTNSLTFLFGKVFKHTHSQHSHSNMHALAAGWFFLAPLFWRNTRHRQSTD